MEQENQSMYFELQGKYFSKINCIFLLKLEIIKGTSSRSAVAGTGRSLANEESRRDPRLLSPSSCTQHAIAKQKKIMN